MSNTITITAESNATSSKNTDNHYSVNCESTDENIKKAEAFVEMMCEKWGAESNTYDDSFGEYEVNLIVISSHETKAKQLKSLRAELKAFLKG